jgi:SAM-dependent methyltransferase
MVPGPLAVALSPHSRELGQRATITWPVGRRIEDEALMTRLLPISLAMMVLVSLPGCGRSLPREPAPPQPSAVPVVSVAATQPAHSGHDPAHPPIDCPLRKQGVSPDHLRPFADTEKYIAHLERPERAKWQRPDEVVAALGLSGSETVVDLGAGSGYFSFRFARVLPRGKVIASDIDPEMVRHIHHRAMTKNITNLQAVLARPDDPLVPAHADVVFICDVLHHVKDRAAWLAKLAKEMHAGARLVVVEFKEGPLPEGPPENAKINRKALVELLTGAGFKLETERRDLLPYQLLLDLRRP